MKCKLKASRSKELIKNITEIFEIKNNNGGNKQKQKLFL